MTRCSRRTVSDRFSSSSWNGGVGEALRISIACASDLDLAGDEVGIDRALGARPHDGPSTAMQNSLRSFSASREGRGTVRIEDDLHQALAIAQVDEDDAAVVAPAVDPAHQR